MRKKTLVYDKSGIITNFDGSVYDEDGGNVEGYINMIFVEKLKKVS